MKLRCVPEDFQVEELTDFTCGGGAFALYRLTKCSLGTPEAIAAVIRRWKIPRQRISYGGLKDRHALTRQYVTIAGGPSRGLRQTSLELEYLGQADRPFTPAEICGNRFEIVLRDVADADVAAMTDTLSEIERDGLPNYFDEQRFGSVGEGGDFVARAWCAGDYDRALWLALAEANVHDRPRDRQEKRSLREQWRNWPACLRATRGTPRKAVFAHLVRRSNDVRGALARISPDQRGLYLAAFQSYLWNRLLATALQERCPPDNLLEVPIDRWRVPFFRALDPETRAELHGLELPLPSARLHLEAGPMKSLIDRVLAAEELQLRELRVKYPRDSFFARGERPAIARVAGLTHASEPDELHSGARKLTLRFELGRGSYATILVKRLSAEPHDHR
jgi:tRNA pseudouridine13 synthase